MKALGIIACALVVIGGLNWGLVGVFKFDLVAKIFGEMTMATRVVYVLVGLAALKHILMCKKGGCCKAE